MQEKLRAAKVAVAGLGGLGSNIAVMLARSGIGKLLLVDFDVVDVTNLNRQMYFIPQLGKPKTEALAELLVQINPYTEYETVCTQSNTGKCKGIIFGISDRMRGVRQAGSESNAGAGASHPVSEDDSRIGKRNGGICRYKRDQNTADDAAAVCVRRSEHGCQ